MKSYTNLVERRYYTSIGWSSRENPQMGVKAIGHSSTPGTKKAHQALTYLIDKFTTSTQMGVGHQGIGT
jgi:hypothetical protein